MGVNNPQTLRLIEDINSFQDDVCYEIVGWIDNDDQKIGNYYFGYKVLGTPDILEDERYHECCLINNITRDALTRYETTKRLQSYDMKFETLISPRVNCEGVTIGEGCIIHEGVILESHVYIDDFVVIATGCIVCHESKIGAYSFLSSGVRIAGLVEVEACVTLFLSAMVSARLNIGEGSTVSAGSVVFEDVKKNQKVLGNPARAISTKNNKKTQKDDTISNKLNSLLKESFPSLLKIDEEEYFADHDMLTSFELFTLMTALEEHFFLSIKDSEVSEENIGSVSNLKKFIKRKKGSK